MKNTMMAFSFLVMALTPVLLTAGTAHAKAAPTITSCRTDIYDGYSVVTCFYSDGTAKHTISQD